MRLTVRAGAIALFALIIFVASLSAQTSVLPPETDTLAASPDGSKAKKESLFPAFVAAARYDGAVVRDISFQGTSDDPKVLQGFRELVLQQTGERLDRQKIRKSLTALYATGRFADLRVEAVRNQQDEVSLVFVGRQNYFIGPVSVEGAPKHPNQNLIVTASKLQLGELYTADKLKRAIENMMLVLAENGFYQATITHEERYDPRTQLVTVIFQLTPGKLARVGSVTVDGSSGLTAAQVQDIGHIHPGDTVSADRVTRALQRLRKNYQRGKRLEAQVAVVKRDYHEETNTLDYTFGVNRGSVVSIRVEGVKLREGLMKKYIPVFEENAVDDDLLNEGRRNLRDYFQTRGYFDVKVNFSKEYEQANNRLDVIYTVDKGTSRKLTAIKISGNKYFSSDLILERMNVRAASGFLEHGIFSQSLLAADVQSIENLYKSNGFSMVKVSSSVLTGPGDSKDDISVMIKIDEGPQVRVAALKIVGNKVLSEERIRDRVQLLENQPFSQSRLAEDRDAIANYYYDNGFANVQFETSVTPASGDPNLLNVTYTIREGQQVFVDRVLVSGLHYTRPFVVRRQMKIREGNPMSQIGLLDSQRSLYDLGLFNEVDTAIQNPDGGAKYKDVLLNIQEAKRWTFNYGFGLEVQTGSGSLNANQINTAPAPGINVPPNTTPPQGTISTANPNSGTGVSPSVSFDVTRLNFRGRDHTVLFKTSYSNLSRRALLSYDAPHWWDKDNLRLTFTALVENTRDVRTFAAERYEQSVQAEQVRSKVTTLLYRFEYRLVKVQSGTLVISPELVPLFSKPVRVGMPSFTYIRDKRDDPIDTHKGNYTTFDTGVAAGVFGSAANFGRFMIQNSTYVPIKRKFVLARLTRIGVQEPFGTGQQAITPLPERFYAGGNQSHRGFALNQAGPRDLFTGFPVGGNAVFLNQIELRLPNFTVPFAGNNLNFVLFHDAGNVFNSGQDMVQSLFRWYQPRRESCSNESSRLLCGFNYMQQAFGLGARYKTPVGPVRLDFSYNPNPPTFPYYVQCPSVPPAGKNPGPCATLPGNSLIFQSGTLRHFNIFFSVGQTF